MSKESAFQTKVANWLRAKGCFVMVIQPQAGIPTGTPDIIALCDGGGWIALELKAHEKAKVQPLQNETVAKLDQMYFARKVWPLNWDEIKKELELII
jgi:Holliday junction resolvase